VNNIDSVLNMTALAVILKHNNRMTAARWCEEAAAEIRRLREVLKPMAEVASDIPDDWSDDHQCVTACGHFRQAKQALDQVG
jgi:hypothetical protein